MSETPKPVGSISWTDLTVADAEGVRKFYEAVVGWTADPVDMGDYQDYCMQLPGSGDTVAGICHARGVNANMPPQWLVYITVENLQQSIDRCLSMGGKVRHQREATPGEGALAVIEDPVGAVAALYQPVDDA